MYVIFAHRNLDIAWRLGIPLLHHDQVEEVFLASTFSDLLDKQGRYPAAIIIVDTRLLPGNQNARELILLNPKQDPPPRLILLLTDGSTPDEAERQWPGADLYVGGAPDATSIVSAVFQLVG